MRDKIKQRVRGAVKRLSGEYSSAAPDEVIAYSRPGVADESAEVVMAKLNRPSSKRKQNEKS